MPVFCVPCGSHARHIRGASGALSHSALHLSCCHSGGMLGGDKLIVFQQMRGGKMFDCWKTTHNFHTHTKKENSKGRIEFPWVTTIRQSLGEYVSTVV